MKLRRRIVLVLGSSKYPLKEEELTFIKSSTHNNLGEVISINNQSFTLAFGARKVRESDIENSLTVCIAIREHIPATRFGVSYGLVSVDEKKDGSIKIEGQITKVIMHLSSIASYSHISVDESITKIYSRIFDIRHIKAKDKDVYNVYGFKQTPSRIRGLREAYGKLIGRDKEFAELQNLLLQIASDQGQMVGVVGEAGIGKTRLTHELKTLLKMRGIKYYEGSFPYFGGSTYKGFKDIISGIANITTQDPVQNIEKKLKRIGDKYELEKSDVNFLVNLYSIIPVSETLKHLNEEQIKLGTFVAIKKLIFKIAENPLVIILEDMQNADELSASLADFMAEGLPEMKLLFYMNYRPEFHGKFEEKIYFNWIRLQRFDEQKAKEFLSSLLDIAKIPKKLLKLIQKKSAGNPLYIEELVRSLLDKGKIRIVQQLEFTEDICPSDIQPTIHGVISYRMEKLPQETSQVLKWGSCIGDEIDVKLLKTILKRNISKEIEELELKDFIYEVSIYPEEIYRFRHDFIREVAYETLPLDQRQSIHLKIGKYLEKKFKFEMEERLEDITNHFIKSSDNEKAFDYALRTAKKLKSKYSNEEAVRLFRITYGLTDKIKIKDKKDTKKKILENLKDIFVLTAKYEEAHKIAKEYGRLINKKNRLELADLHRLIGEIYKSQGALAKADKHLKQSLECSKEFNNRSGKIKALSLLAGVHGNLENIDLSNKYAKETLKLITDIELAEKGYVYILLGNNYNRIGEYEKSINFYNKSIEIFESLNSLNYLSLSHLNISLPYMNLRDTSNHLDHLHKSINISKVIGNLDNLIILYMNLAVYYLRAGHIQKALQEYSKIISLLKQTSQVRSFMMAYSNLCSIHRTFLAFKTAKEYLDKSKKCYHLCPSNFWKAVNLQHEGLINKNLKHYKNSKLNSEKAVKIFEKIKDESKAVEVLCDLVDLNYETSNKEELLKIENIFRKKEKMSISVRAREKMFLARLKINLSSGKKFALLNQYKPSDYENWHYPFKFDLYNCLSKYYKEVENDLEKSNLYRQKLINLYENLLTELPEDFESIAKIKSEYRSLVNGIDLNISLK